MTAVGGVGTRTKGGRIGGGYGGWGGVGRGGCGSVFWRCGGRRWGLGWRGVRVRSGLFFVNVRGCIGEGVFGGATFGSMGFESNVDRLDG